MPVQNLSMCDLSDLNRLVESGIKFPTILMDPPWRYGNKASRGAAENHYPTMSLPEIASLPVGELATKNAHLHLWTTNGFLFEAERLMQMWDFIYKSMLVWTKPQMGCGSYWRVSHEFLLLGVKGKLTFADRSLKSWVEADRKTHSEKPECVREMIERASPGPYLEFFGRKPVDGWVVFGNEIERNAFDLAVSKML
jgi:N6-adenosine-specific RNA methylase IME4